KETSRGDELDNLEVDHETHHQINHPLQSANPDAENTNTQNIVTNLIEHQQIESAEMLSNDSNKETSRGDELDNLEVDHETNHQINHPLQSANLDAENTNTQNIVTNLIGHQQIEYAEISSNYSDKETSRYDALEDITVIQRNTQQDDSISQVVDDIKLNFTANNTPSNIPTENIKARKENVENTSIELKKIEDNNNSLFLQKDTSQEKIPAKIVSSNLEDNSLETQIIENIPDSNEESSRNNFVNLLNQLSENLPDNLPNNLPAPIGYATGGLVAQTKISDNPPIAPSDTVPAMLTPGEFVINARDAQKY
ncbi:MAG: hypothetical protein HC903_26195, partial [Methylacidiphilales bacterium]|nr:hypothetical protein [Candidatus Methylacidiphilales bacterium]